MPWPGPGRDIGRLVDLCLWPLVQLPVSGGRGPDGQRPLVRLSDLVLTVGAVTGGGRR